MAVVLVVRPWGLLGRPQAREPQPAHAEAPLRAADATLKVLAAALLGCAARAAGRRRPARPTLTVLAIDLLIAALFAASLHFIMGPAGMHSFGHAAYFGLGAYGAALLVRALGLPMELALRRRAAGRGGRRARVRLVLRAAVGRVPRDADAGVRADRLVGRLPVGRASPAAATA